MSLLQETKDIQGKMALYCRTGTFQELPGLTPNRFHHYRRLVCTNLEDNLASSFPIACKYTEGEPWERMVSEFFSKHKCQSYQVWQIAGEFYDYAVKENFAEKYHIPYLNDLLQFEWEEMAVYNMEDRSPGPFTPAGDFLKDAMVLNPEHALLQLHYPIHRFNPLTALEKKGNYFVLLYREQASGRVQFLDLSPWCALLIEQLAAQNATVAGLLEEAPNVFGAIDPGDLKESTLVFLNELSRREFILGFKTHERPQATNKLL